MVIFHCYVSSPEGRFGMIWGCFSDGSVDDLGWGQGSGRWRAHQFHRRFVRRLSFQDLDIRCHMGVSENVVKTPLYPMVLLIIIPIKWLFNWEYTLFSDKPICSYAELPQFLGHGAIAQISTAKGASIFDDFLTFSVCLVFPCETMSFLGTESRCVVSPLDE